MVAASRSVQSGFSRLTDGLSDPAREAMVSALFGGKALPAGELAVLAGVSPQSASAHLQKLTDARLLSVWQQGRFRYYRIADDEVAGLIENLVNVAARTDHAERARGVPTPLRQARTCYCHLAGQLGVALRDGLVGKELIAPRGREAFITDQGLAWCRAEAIDFKPGRGSPHAALQRLDRACSASGRSVRQCDPEGVDRDARAGPARRSTRASSHPEGARLLRTARRFNSVLMPAPDDDDRG